MDRVLFWVEALEEQLEVVVEEVQELEVRWEDLLLEEVLVAVEERWQECLEQTRRVACRN